MFLSVIVDSSVWLPIRNAFPAWPILLFAKIFMGRGGWQSNISGSAARGVGSRAAHNILSMRQRDFRECREASPLRASNLRHTRICEFSLE
jgi:hypothetical protein